LRLSVFESLPFPFFFKLELLKVFFFDLFVVALAASSTYWTVFEA